jgi:hypothetical protein
MFFIVSKRVTSCGGKVFSDVVEPLLSGRFVKDIICYPFQLKLELRPLEIAPTRNCTHIVNWKCIKSFCMHKTNFFLTISFLYLIYSIGGYIGNKTQVIPSEPQKLYSYMIITNSKKNIYLKKSILFDIL